MASWVACDLRTAARDTDVLVFDAPDNYAAALNRAVQLLRLPTAHRGFLVVLAIAEGESRKAAVERARAAGVARRLGMVDRGQGVVKQDVNHRVGEGPGTKWDVT